MRILITSILVGIALIIYGISIFRELDNGKPTKKGNTRQKAFLMLLLGAGIFVCGTYISVYLRDHTSNGDRQVHHELYKDFTYEEWRNEADEALAKYKKNTAKMDKGMYELQSVAMQMVLRDGVQFKNDLDSKANLTGDQIQQLKDYWDAQWEITRNNVNAQVEANDRQNYPNKYQ